MYLIEGETNVIDNCLKVGKGNEVHRNPELEINIAHVIKRPPDWNACGVFAHPFETKLLTHVAQRTRIL
jgi:hypothetical protein